MKKEEIRKETGSKEYEERRIKENSSFHMLITTDCYIK
jgi:hypothetical protein